MKKLIKVLSSSTLGLALGLAAFSFAPKQTKETDAAYAYTLITTGSCSGFSSNYGVHKTTTIDSKTWVGSFGQPGYLGANNDTNYAKALLTNANDLEVAQGYDSSITSSTKGYTVFYCESGWANVGKIVYSATAKALGGQATSYLLSKPAGGSWGLVTVDKDCTQQGEKVSTAAAYSFTYTFAPSATVTQFAMLFYRSAYTRQAGSSMAIYSATEANSYNITFNGNGADGSMTADTVTGSEYTAPECTFTAPSGKIFAGWKLNGEGDLIQPNAKVTGYSADFSLVAQWVDIITVSFNANGGTGTMSPVDIGNSYTIPACSFVGPNLQPFDKWNTEDDGTGTDYAPGDVISPTSNMTLYAIWKDFPSSETYDFSKISNFSSWTSSYSERTITHTNVGAEIPGTFVLNFANKQSSGVGSTYPSMATKSASIVNAGKFTLNISGKKIAAVTITFVQRGTNSPTLALYKGDGITSTAVDTLTVNAGADVEQTLSVASLNDTCFTLGYSGSTGSNLAVGIKSIYISIVDAGSFGTLDHIKVTAAPKIVYTVGDSFDTTGLEVTAFDNADEASAEFMDVTSDVTLDLANGYTFVAGDVGTKVVTVTYNSKTTSISLTIHALGQFELVNSEQLSWEGKYIIVGTMDDNNYAMDGSAEPIDAINNFVQVTDTEGIVNVGVQYTFTISKVDGGYSILSSSGKYIGSLTENSNGLLTDDAAIVNTITYNDGVVITGTNGRTLKLNTSSGQERFRYYTNTNKVKLYRAVSSTAQAWAQSFIDGLHCDNGVNAPSTTEWADLAESYALLSADDKVLFTSLAGNTSGNVIEQALARYDLVVSKYGKTTYADFMNRNPQPISNARLMSLANSGSAATTIIIVVSVVSVSMLGFVLVLKKRRINAITK